MAEVNFSLVRYSPSEGTHYFWDPAHPTAIQFLLSGGWESWDVGWVKHNARDPDIRRICSEAEARLLQDPESNYVPWPIQPPTIFPVNLPRNNAASEPGVERSQSDMPVDMAPWSSSGDLRHPISPSASTPERNVETALLNTDSSPAHSTLAGQLSSTLSACPKSLVEAVRTDSTSLHPQPTHHAPLQPAAPTRVILSRRRETKILLSLDGDGIRGLSTLLIVESLVNAVCVRLNQRLDTHQIFDLAGGSSLGGIIAIMLCRLRMQTYRAREAYREISRQAYLDKRNFFNSLSPDMHPSSTNAAALEEIIKYIVQEETGRLTEPLLDGREESGDVFVVSTHVEIGSNKAALIRSYQTRRITGPEVDSNMTIWQAMRATSVAPRYILPQPGINQRLVIEPGLVDHGTAKNNPVRDILYECRKLFRYTNDMMIIVSIGTGVGLNRDNEIIEMAKSVEDRNIEARTWGEKFEVDHEALIERGWMKYFRFNVTGMEDIPLEEWCHEEKIKEKTSTYLAMPEVGQKFYACVDAIATLLLSPHGRYKTRDSVP